MGYCYYQTLPRCSAYARSTGNSCRQAAMQNGRCYIHGGKSPIKHGRCTKVSKWKRQEERKRIKELRNSQKTLAEFVDNES